jgi:hypothetical protein
MAKALDLLIKNVRAVRPNAASVDTVDIAVRDGKFTGIGPESPGVVQPFGIGSGLHSLRRRGTQCQSEALLSSRLSDL